MGPATRFRWQSSGGEGGPLATANLAATAAAEEGARIPQTQEPVRLLRQTQQKEPWELQRRPKQRQQQRLTLVPWQRLRFL